MNTSFFKFPLDSFQKNACSVIDKSENVLVCAKTGSGKTLIAEYQIHVCLTKSQRIFYTTPIKSLSNQKYHDLKKQFPENSVGILTGDIKFCPDAQIVVMTTEILRNLLYKQGTVTEQLGLTANLSLDNLGAVIFDECHYMNDPDRGHIWEECLILIPDNIQLVLLSATLESPEFLANWLSEIKGRKCHLIQTTYRVVPLQHAVLFPNSIGMPMEDNNINNFRLEVVCTSKGIFKEQIYTDWLKANENYTKSKQALKIDSQCIQAAKDMIPTVIKSQSGRPESFQHRMNAALGFLNNHNMLPALFFVLSRRGCEKYANLVTYDLLEKSEAASVRNITGFHLSRYKHIIEKMPQWLSLFPLLQRGIAYHHSGLIPVIKEIIELLFSRGLIKILFCTETFAVGLNMPTKTTLFAGFHKYDEQKDQLRILRTDEYLQMAGRAGRRGKDKEGWAIYLPEREPINISDMRKMMVGSCQIITSRIELGFDLILKTLLSSSVYSQTSNSASIQISTDKKIMKDPIQILQNSYLARTQQKLYETNLVEIAQLEKKIKDTGISSDVENELIERARLETEFKQTTNALKKKAQSALESWKNRHQGRWDQLWKSWGQVRIWKENIEQLYRECQELQNYKGILTKRLMWLEKEGYLTKDSICDDPTLTTLGIAATEVNEACPFILPAFYVANPELRTEYIKNPNMLICLLSCFLEKYWKGEDGIQPEPSVIIRNSKIPAIIKDGYFAMEKIALRLKDVEGIQARTTELSGDWAELIWRWLEESGDLSVLCREYELFEGNFTRGIMKLGNILDEWLAIAILLGHTEQIEAVAGLRTTLQKDFVIQDSLYLHLD